MKEGGREGNNVPVIRREEAKNTCCVDRVAGRLPMHSRKFQYSLLLTQGYTLYDAYWHNIDTKYNFQL